MTRRGVATGAVATIVALTLVVASPASAYWPSGGAGEGSAASGALAAPTQVTAVQDGAAAASIAWVASAGAPVPDGYFVERLDGAVGHAACGSSRDTLVPGSGCVDSAIPDGIFAYRVTAVYRSWTAPSLTSAPVQISTPLLGAATPFSVLGTAVTTTGFTRVSGDLGVSPGSAVVGFPDGIVDGEIHAGDGTAADAQTALVAASAELGARTADALLDGDLGNRILGPGVYFAAGALGNTGVLTLDAGGDPNAVFVFQVDAAVTTAASSSMLLRNGATAANVYWVVNGAVTTGGASSFSGSILAQGAITLGAAGTLIGRALSRDAVTMADNVVRFTAEPGPTLSIDGGGAMVTKQTAPAISGSTTAPAGRTVTVTIAGQTLTTETLPDQTWSVTAGPLDAGSYAVVAKVEDAAGNGATATQTLLVEVNPPAIELGVAAPFSILAGGTVVSTGVSHADGDVGVSPGTSITGLGADDVGGSIYAGDLTAADALAALDAALADATARAPHTEFGGDLVGRVFHAGVHHSGTALTLSGAMTLDGEGDPNAVFVFRVDAAMTTAAGSSVLLIGGASADNVFWVVDAAVDTGASAQLPGTILATGTITLGAGTQLTGRALTLGSIVLADTTITAPVQPEGFR